MSKIESKIDDRQEDFHVAIKTAPLTAALKRLTKVFDKSKNGKANLLILELNDGQATLTAQTFQASSSDVRYASKFDLLNEDSHTFEKDDALVPLRENARIALNAQTVPAMIKALTSYKPLSVIFRWDTPEVDNDGSTKATPVSIGVAVLGNPVRYISQSEDRLYQKAHGENPC